MGWALALVAAQLAFAAPAPAPNACREDKDCRLILSSCGCEAVPAADPRKRLDDPAICARNVCWQNGPLVRAVCKRRRCVKKPIAREKPAKPAKPAAQ